MSPKVIAITELLKLLTYEEIDDLNEFVKDHLPAAPVPCFWVVSPIDEEKTQFEVWLESCGPNKINMIKLLRGQRKYMGLYDAKVLVESAPALFIDRQSKTEAEELKCRIEEIGGKASIR